VGEVITAEVVSVDDNFVVVNAGLKSESIIPIEEFRNDAGGVDVKPGDFVSVSIEALEDGFGATRLSRDKAKRMAAWLELEKALESGEKIEGMITGKVKGGLTVMAKGIRAFLPGSLVDLRPVKDTTPYEGKAMQFKVIKLDRKRNNVVVSRRAVLEETAGAEREQLLASLQEGATVKGIVKNITDYGAFVDLGGIDGLLHITDLAWRRVKHPSEVLNVGDEVTAKVLKFDSEKNRVSLGLKQLGEDPVGRHRQKVSAGDPVVRESDQPHRLRRVRRGGVGHRGPGARLGDGLDQQERAPVEGGAGRRRGRGHDPRNRRGAPPHLARHEAVHAQPVGRLRPRVQEGRQGEGPDQVDHRLRRVRRAAGRHRRPRAPLGPLVVGRRRGGGEELQEGRGLEAVVLSIDVERERISLGVKQLEGDPFTNFIASHEKNSVVSGKVKSLDAKGAVIELGGDVEGYLRASEFSRDRIDDLRAHLNEGDTVQAMIINVDRKNRSINLSVKAKDLSEETEAMKQLRTENAAASAGATNLGALLRAKLDKGSNNPQQ